MKRVIRKGIYESASSSVHSLVISSDGMEPSKLPVDKDGYITVRYGEFGKDGTVYSSQEDKLSYLVTQCYYLGGLEYDVNRDNNYHFKHVEDAIIDYTGEKGIKIIGGEPDIDHQTLADMGYGELYLIQNEWDEKEIQSFVFNKYISLLCDCD